MVIPGNVSTPPSYKYSSQRLNAVILEGLLKRKRIKVFSAKNSLQIEGFLSEDENPISKIEGLLDASSIP